MPQKKSSEQFGFVRVAAVVPKMKVADISYNTEQIIEAAIKTSKQGASFIVFPELCITGYTVGDLFHQDILLEDSLKALQSITQKTKTLLSVIVVGLPIIIDGKIFNIAAVVSQGNILGLVPKTYIPGYKEFYEKRWFSPAENLISKEIDLFGKKVPVGSDILFKSITNKHCIFGVEICEDLWGPLPPSSFHAIAGATIIANLSASNELVGKANYRRELVVGQSARSICGYIYTSCGMNESTTDLVFSGHALIADNNTLLTESKRFSPETEIISADIDLLHIVEDRVRTTSFGDTATEIKKKPYRYVDLPNVIPQVNEDLKREIAENPFLPKDISERNRVAEEIFEIQVSGLLKRLQYTGIKKVLVGLSGGLDSTLALLVCIEAFKKARLPIKNICTITMPGFGTTKGTRSNAYKLAEASGVSIEEISITDGAEQQFKDIQHDGKNEDVTFENVQARYRTMILMNKSNQIGGLVVGTGDLSEIALGWNTFTGDHVSHYNVNAGVPKTLVRHIVEWRMNTELISTMQKVLNDILNTPISPELKSHAKGKIAQKTEEIIGPYALHDFFLYHFLRWGSSPKKIRRIAKHAFGGTYTNTEITKWLKVFISRFFRNQWKRSVMPDGPKIGSVALSPRGDWRMPSDAELDIWLKELDS